MNELSTSKPSIDGIHFAHNFSRNIRYSIELCDTERVCKLKNPKILIVKNDFPAA
jgi:hypothetical protein